MRNLFTCFSNFWSNILGAPHSASIGTRWKPAGNLHSLSMCAVMLVLLFVVGVGNVWGAEKTAYTLSGTTTGGTSGYTTQSITQSSKNWTVQGNTNVSPWRIGISKGNGDGTDDFPIYSQTAISEDVTKIILSHGDVSRATVNSVTIQVYSTAALAAAGGDGDVDANIASSDSWAASSSMTFNKPAGHNWANRFYRIVYNMDYSTTSGKSGKPAYMQFSSAVFKYDDAPACSAPAAPTISGTAAYTAGQTITLTASCASGADASTTYTWYKGADWATARAASPVQATSTSGATFTKASCVVGDAGKYWCEASNGSGCEAHNSTGYDVTVSAGSVAVTGVSVDPTSKTIFVGETFDITPTVAPANATNKNVSWSSSATSYATVISGTVTGVAAGSSTITCRTTDGGYTATCAVTVYGVTMQARDEDGNAIGVGGPGAPTRSGTTITAAANAGNYVFKQWDVVNATAASSTTSPTTISNPTGAVTVTAVYYKPVTITYKANGATFTTQTYARGGTLAFPVSEPDGATYSCTGKTFVGWVGETNKDYSNASTPPTYATAGGSITAAATYYAVFADASSGGGYEQVTSLSSIHEGSAYFAYYGSYSGSRWYGVNAINTVVAPVDVSEGELTTSKTGDGAYTLQEFTLVAVDASNYEYYIKIGNKYVTASGDKADLSVGNDAYLWKFNSINSTNYNLEILHDASTDYYIKVGVGSATGGKFRSYTSSGQQVSLFQSSTTYSNYATTCCTPLGAINGSVNLSTSSTGTSVTVSVLTEGVNAYGDANNVSGYDFNLYTAASGGSAAATYSSDSKAGTSHTFTGLIPLTQYWVTVRPIGSGSYCNTTEESTRRLITTTCVAPNHVDISGRWDRFGGETISLTATAYSSAGTSSPIDAEDITGYQWQKLISSTWTDVSDGTTDGVTTSGATTNNLQISSCKLNNSGKYRCIVSTGATCSTASATATDGTEGFDVKVYVLECYTGGTTVYNFTRVGDTQAGTAQITLTAGNKEFKVHADNYYYGKNVTINEDENNVVLCNSGDAVCSANLTIAAGLGGTFTISMEYSSAGGSSSVEGEPEISVTYPRKTIYLTPGVWNVDGAKFAIYYFRKVGETTYGNGWTDFITANDCGSSADIPQWNGVKMDVVRLKNTCTSPNWSDKWAQTNDITVSSNDYVTITGWGENDYTYTAYAIPTYTISYATGSVPTGGGSISGSKANETKTCGVDFDLPAAQFTTTGYVQTGWAKTDGGAQYAAVSGSYTDNSAQTFYPVWTANTHTLTWDKNGGDALTGDYTSGTVAYATAITAPNTPTRTGYSFDGWHNGTSIVTPATTMPDNDMTYTAQWSLATYTVTLNTNGGTINAGDVDEYTYGTGATLPTNVTRDGFRFDGWFDNSYCTGDAVTSISSSATGDKAFWAKWTQIYTVTWSVNGDTWESGVVEGNTHVPGGSKVSALPTAPTSSDCDDSKVFVGWRATEIDGTSASDPGGIFTTQAGSPTISANTTFYAVFADSNDGTATLTNDEISAAYCSGAKDAGCGAQTSYGNGPYTISSTGGDWENAVCAINSSSIAMKAANASAELGRPRLISPDYGANVKRITINATNGSGTSRYIYICSSSTATPNTVNIGFGTATNNTTTNVVIEPTSAVSSFYVYVNDALTFNSITVEYGTPSNYVTSCSSCDADATFTNTTPAVSEIGCTSATLTMEDGLATLGADGCHVSDYGFVIGTSDNPAIGGSGVEKLQVGTSDPTVGEDFSYDATGLTKGTRYYIRAYAINRHGTAYSSSQNFWTMDVSSIAITTAPTKTNYIVGETFDATGMVVTATMASSATEDVTSDVTYSESALTSGTNQNFAINYTLCETEVSVNQKINVYTLSVTEGTNDSYGTASGSANIVSITGLGSHKTYTVTVTSDNADVVDNGDNTWSVINPTGNVAVRVDYDDAAQVKVYYKVDGVTVTGLTQDVYQSETTTLPTASELATAMTAQSMDLPDDDYPNFVGWSETEFPAQTAEPTIVTGTPTINAEKTYYAVYTNLSKITIIPSDFNKTYPSSGSADGTKTFGGKNFGWNYLLNGNVSSTNLPLQFKKNSTEYGRLYNTDPLNYILRVEIGYYNSDSNVPVYVASSAGTISGGALTPASRESTDPYVYTMPASTSYFYIKGDNSTVYKIRSVDIYYSPATVYYMTQFCTNRVTLTQNSPEHGTVEFGRSSLVTCGSDKEVSLTIIPDVGYQLTGWTVNTSSGYADAKTTSPAVVTNSNNSAAQNITLTFAEDANKDYDVTATFGLMTVTSWTWTVNSAAIPDPLNLYVGQNARLDVAYTPAGVDASKKTYTRTKVDAYINWVGGLNANYTTITGKASTGENTTPVTFTHADGPETVVNVKVLPLPLVHFGDIVHNVSFDDVVATLSDNTLSPTKTTPTHADFDGSTANTCEEQHLHLVGWIREDWPALVTYLNGGAQPSTSDITTAGDDALGNAYFFAPGASINTQTFNGVTFYAVWAKVE